MPPIKTARGAAARRAQDASAHGHFLDVGGKNLGRLGRYLKQCYATKIEPLIRYYADPDGSPVVRDVRSHLDFVRTKYLPGLQHQIGPIMRKDLASYGRIKKALAELADRNNQLPRDIREKAAALYEEFSNKGWVVTPAMTTVPRPRSVSQASVEYPSEDAAIYGIGGIMENLSRSKRPQIVDRSLICRSSKVYGHNYLIPGFWTPYQNGLVVHGGHYQPVRGISGDSVLGAYSVVISNKYNETDIDQGNVVYYSSEGAEDRTAGLKTGTTANRAMNASIKTHNPIRVFRSAKCGAYAPSCGIRYDGLYECVGKENRMNKAGAPYVRFKLVRLERSDQPSLDTIVSTSPTAQQVADLRRILGSLQE